MNPSVHVRGLTKGYGNFQAVKGIDFEIFPGEVFGLLGPNGAGNMLVFHGPTVHRELQLWVEAGIPPAVALQAATLNAAKLLRADGRIGLVAPGHDANLLLVDGDPTREISATERISMVVLKGERVRRVDLFDAAKNPLR